MNHHHGRMRYNLHLIVVAATSLLGIGCFDDEQPNLSRIWVFMALPTQRKAIQEAVLVIAVGARLLREQLAKKKVIA